MAKANCKPVASCPSCTTTALTRNHYFTGKLLVERDFVDEQRYAMERMRLHNQRLHGSGVPCGLAIHQHGSEPCQPRYVLLEPGSAVDCCGRDILVPLEDTIDLQAFPAVKALFDKPDGVDHVLQLRLCYRECPTEEIPVLYADCGCDDSACAPNRILESYCVEVALDPPAVPAAFAAPALSRTGTIGVEHALAVALDDAGARLFVVSGDASGAIYQVDAGTMAIETSVSLGRQALALALSADATRLYAVVASATAGSDTELWVFDVSGPATLAGGAVDSAPVAGSGTAAPVLAVAASGLLLAAYTNGKLYAWKPGDAANAPSESLTLTAAPTGLACASDGKVAWVSSQGSDTLTVLDLTQAGFAPAKLQVPGTDLATLATVVRGASPDLLAAGDRAAGKLHLVDPAQPTGTAPISSVSLSDQPTAIAVSPGGNWAYVDLHGGALQIVDLSRMALHETTTPSAPFAIGPGTEGVTVTATGATLYVPYAGASPGSAGGVAVIGVKDEDCAALLHELRDCPDCGGDACLVLATVHGWRPGRRLLDLVDPPTTPADDAAAGIARIDNLDGRKLLASTETLQEVVECLLNHGGNGTPGPQGPPGLNGQNGAAGPAGPGLDVGIPRITALSWTHATLGNQLVSVGNDKALVIGFSHPVSLVGDTGGPVNPFNEQFIFEVQLPDPNSDQKSFRCRCPIVGALAPVTFTTASGNDKLIASASPSTWPAPGIAFTLTPEALKRIERADVFVLLRGDCVVDQDGNAVDAELVRGTLPTGDRRKASGGALPPADPETLLSIPGGRFESWFSTRVP